MCTVGGPGCGGPYTGLGFAGPAGYPPPLGAAYELGGSGRQVTATIAVVKICN